MPRVALIALAVLFVLAACGGTPEPPPPAEPTRPAAAVEEVAPADPATRDAFDRLMAYAAAERLDERPIGEIVQALGAQLLGAPYREGTLDVGDREELVVMLTGFDCVTFVESVLALAQAVRAGAPTYAAFVANLEALRYRDGAREGYCSRLHYFSDWLLDNDARGRIALATDALPGVVPFTRRVSFMSANRQAYPRLAGDDEALACIRGVEADLNAALATSGMTYLPQERIRTAYGQLRAGDLVAITSDVGGLDIAHTGFVYRFADGRTGFLHASTTGRVVREENLQRYVQGNRRQTGIMVARPLEVPAP